MAENQLDITIRTKAELAGAKAAEGALRATKEAAAGASAESKSLAGAQREIERTLKEATGRAAEQTEQVARLGSGKRNLRDVLRTLSREFPILGSAARFAMTPIAAAIGTAVFAATALRRQLLAIGQVMDQLDARQARRGGWVTSHKEELIAASVAAQSHAEALRKIAGTQPGITAQTLAAIEALRKAARAEGEIDDAQKGLELTRIDEDARAGKIPEEEAERRRAAVEKKFRERAIERAKQLDEAEIAKHEEELKAIKHELTWAARRAQEAAAPVEEISRRKKIADDAATVAEANIQLGREGIEKLNEERDNARSTRRKATGAAGGWAAIAGALFETPHEKNVSTELDARGAELDALRRQKASDDDARKQLALQLDAAQKAQAEARAKEVELTERKTELEQTLPQMRGDAASAHQHRRAIETLTTQREQIATQGRIEAAKERAERERQEEIRREERLKQQQGRQLEREVNGSVPLSFNSPNPQNGIREEGIQLVQTFNAFAAEERAVLRDLARAIDENRVRIEQVESRRNDMFS
jgi:hypothetical protein